MCSIPTVKIIKVSQTSEIRMSHKNNSVDLQFKTPNTTEASIEHRGQLDVEDAYCDTLWNEFVNNPLENINTPERSLLNHTVVRVPNVPDCNVPSKVVQTDSRVRYRSKGSGSILNSVHFKQSKVKKLSLIEQSKSEWDNFKAVEGLNEEFNTFNKGKAGFLQRQDFLQRTDLRQFEIERNLRRRSRKAIKE